MKSFKKIIFVIAAAALLTAGCRQSGNYAPIDPKWDRDVCARCAMQLGDRLHSAQIIDKNDGSRYYFDDVGCAVGWLDKRTEQERSGSELYVADATDGSWLKASEAFYAEGFKTPMAYGIAAFRTSAQAGEGAEVFGWEEARSKLLEAVNERAARKAAGMR